MNGETDILQSFQTKEQYKINHQLDWNDKCLIFLLSCKACGLQYVGSTTDKFRLRWNNYNENNRKAKRREEHMKPLIFTHSSSKDHNDFLEDFSITLTDKIDRSDPTRRQEYWRRVLKTVTSYESNTIDWFIYLSKYLNSCKILYIFRGKGVYIVEYILLTYIVSCICYLCL